MRIELSRTLKQLGWQLADYLGLSNVPFFDYAAMTLYAATLALLVFAYASPIAKRTTAVIACGTACFGVLSMWLSYSGEATPTFEPPTIIAKKALKRRPFPFAQGEEDDSDDDAGDDAGRSGTMRSAGGSDGEGEGGGYSASPVVPASFRQMLGLGNGDDDRIGTPFRDCPECPELVMIRKGTFSMGGEGRRVHIGKRFAIGRFEVTRAQYGAFERATGHTSAACAGQVPQDPAKADLPRICISWEDSLRYLDWLSSRTGRYYRLPTEAEWEYVARADVVPTAGHHGAQPAHANLAIDRIPNAFNVYDMLGNFAELVEDCWQTIPSYGVRLLGSTSCATRTLKGNSWRDVSGTGNPVLRRPVPATAATDAIGFRVVREER